MNKAEDVADQVTYNFHLLALAAFSMLAANYFLCLRKK